MNFTGAFSNFVLILILVQASNSIGMKITNIIFFSFLIKRMLINVQKQNKRKYIFFFKKKKSDENERKNLRK